MDSGGAGEPVRRLQKLDELVTSASRMFDMGQEQKALNELKKAQLQYKNDGEAQLILGKAFTDADKDKEAIECLNKSISLEPNKEWDKYVCLAQLVQGEEAIKNYEMALKVLLLENPDALKIPQKKVDINVFLDGDLGMDMAEEQDITQEDVRDIQLSILDNYLSDDLWSQPNSKLKSREIIDNLLAFLPNDFDTLQTVASYYLRCDDKPQATKYIQQAISQWEPNYAKLKDRCKGLDEADEYMETAVNFNVIPSFEHRIITITILADVGLLQKAEEIGQNMLEVENVNEFRLFSAMAHLYEKLGNKEKQKEMLVEAFTAGVMEELFEIEALPPAGAGEEEPIGAKDRSAIISKYVELGGTEEDLKAQVETKMEEHDNMGSDDGESDEEDDDDDDDDDDEDGDEDEMEE